MGYKYYNTHPNGWHIPDCVIRAITLAMNIPYFEVVKLLNSNADYFECDCLNKQCYEKLLDCDFNLAHYKCEKVKTANEVAEDFSDNILLLRMDGHLSCSIFGVIHDIWDCSDEIITDFWIIDEEGENE